MRWVSIVHFPLLEQIKNKFIYCSNQRSSTVMGVAMVPNSRGVNWGSCQNCCYYKEFCFEKGSIKCTFCGCVSGKHEMLHFHCGK